MASWDPRQYWEDRLSSDFSLNGVGFRRLGPSFNKWAYKVRGERFRAVVAGLGIDWAGADVLDVGSGTGFYIDRWDELGVRRVTGVDVTETAVKALSSRFPDKTFLRLDIGTAIDGLEPASFDAVSAMDVLFHIVDDAAFARAIQNVGTLLKPGGVFIWSDAFLHRPAVRIRHQVSRPLADIERTVAEAGLSIESRVPMFVLMNNPVDVRNPVVRGAWLAAAGLLSLSDRLGDWAGRRLYPVELRLAARRTEGPTTEIMVCRKPLPAR